MQTKLPYMLAQLIAMLYHAKGKYNDQMNNIYVTYPKVPKIIDNFLSNRISNLHIITSCKYFDPLIFQGLARRVPHIWVYIQ